jgi:hypothetical protein
MIDRMRKLLLGPRGPYLVLATAILLPGFGHVLVGKGKRGLTMQMFMISAALITWHLTTPAQSLVGRLAGGIFVYAMSIPEAYRLAKFRSLTQQAVRGVAAPLRG